MKISQELRDLPEWRPAVRIVCAQCQSRFAQRGTIEIIEYLSPSAVYSRHLTREERRAIALRLSIFLAITTDATASELVGLRDLDIGEMGGPFPRSFRFPCRCGGRDVDSLQLLNELRLFVRSGKQRVLTLP
jgi:hypothetical protein